MKKEKMTMEKLEHIITDGFAKMATKDDLEKMAIMVKNGFDATATKEDLLLTKEEMREGFKAVDKRFGEVEQRLDKIENILIFSHHKKIEKLEDDIRVVKTKLAIH